VSNVKWEGAMHQVGGFVSRRNKKKQFEAIECGMVTVEILAEAGIGKPVVEYRHSFKR
jgi:hypothetical protein